MATVASTIGGFLAPYGDRFRALGWRVDAAAAGASGDSRVVAAFDDVHDLPLSRSLRDVRGLWRAWGGMREVLEKQYDLVHVHTPIASFMARSLIRRLAPERRPAVAYTAHGFHFFEAGGAVANTAFLTAERIAGRWTDRLVVINDEDEEAATRHKIVARRRLVRMPGIGVDTGQYSPAAVPPEAPGQVREQLGIPPNAPLFAVVGELSERKRQADAIAALAMLRHRGAHLALAGDGSERPALEARVRAAGLAGRVHFLGIVTDVRPLVRATTAVLLPSTREGLARSIMEALSLEVPVIASSARGNRELIGDDRGFIFPTGDVRGLANAMSWLIDRPDARQQMGRRGRARMVERYDLGVLLRLHEDLYREMLAERGVS